MRSEKRAEITVFLTLILSVVSAFIISLSTLAERYVSKSEASYATDCAVMSCFAEYNRELFDRFGILLIDSSFKTPEGGIDRIKEHFSMYLTNSLTVNELRGVSVSVSDNSQPCEDKYGITKEMIEYMRDNGSPGFDPDGCFYDLVFTATFDGPSTGTFCITRQYSYESEIM